MITQLVNAFARGSSRGTFAKTIGIAERIAQSEESALKEIAFARRDLKESHVNLR